ncbi:MAG: hypothetical protein WD993_02640 [Thermoleophilaceae bacterium]
MTVAERLDLARPREIRDLLGTAIRIYLGHLPTVLAVGAAVVVPVQLIVAGIGLEELTSSYRETSTTAETVLPTVVSFLVIAPLLAAITIHVLQRLAAGDAPRPGPALQAGLDVFPPVFLAVLLAAGAIAVGLAIFIVPGIFLAVRLYFVAQNAVVDRAHGIDALRHSWELTRGFWWRTLGVVLLANLLALLPGLLVVVPLQSIAESADRQWISLAGMILAETLTAPFVALVSVLLFYDLRARRAAATAPMS